MRVIGIDPGSRAMGYGVVEEQQGRLVHLAHGVIRADRRLPLERRLRDLFAQLGQAVAQYQPDAVAVEGVFAFRNPRSALILGQARAIALLVAAQSGLSVHEYAPAKVKRAVGAGGAAGKEAVARMVNVFFRLPQLPRADACDALAIAICHLHHARFLPRLTRGAQGRQAIGSTSVADRLAPAYHRFEGRGG